MSGKSDTFENDLLKLIFNGTAIANISDNASTSPLTSLYVALHTADPDEGGTQATSEVSYTGYARVAVARGAGWTVVGNVVNPAANIDFGQCTAGTATATYWSVGVAASGAPQVVGNSVLQLVELGDDGDDYTIRCVAECGSEKLVVAAILPVRLFDGR